MLKKNALKFHLILITLFTLIGFSLNASAQTQENKEPDQYVQVSAFANKTTISAGEMIRLGIQQTIHPKWHTYWLNPGDSGLPFDVEWSLPEGFKVSTLEFPTPQKIPYGELTNYGYEGEVVFLQTLTAPQNIKDEPITLTAKTNLLVCHDICIPETHDISITLNGTETPNPSTIENAQNTLPLQKNERVEYYEQGEDFIINVQIEDTSIANQNIYVAPEEWGLIDNNADAKIQPLNSGFQITQKRGERALSEIQKFPFLIVSKENNKSYRFVATPNPDKALAVAPAPTTHDSNQTSDTANESKESSITFGKAFIFALLGGLVLNLMPCVFPVLSMKALSLVQLSGKEQHKAKLYGLSYTAGILLSFAIIAGILIGLKAAGAQIGWGFQLQNPIVISLLAYLVFLIGLSLYGFFELTGRFTNAGQKLANQSGNKGAFFTGVLATLVATPCTAPFMGAAMGYALTQGATASMIIFLALGFGLALPYLALCYIPALRTKLPKPGAWMETFRQLLSFPMFLTAAFLVWVLSQQAGTMSVLIILCAMIAMVFVICLWRVKPKQGFGKIISLALLGLSLLFIVMAPLFLKTQDNHVTASAEYNEQVFSHDKLNSLLEGDAPIFTNMTASWCITCKVNERVAIRTNTIQNLFSDKKIEYLKGDWTNRNAEISQYLNSFDRQGVPLYVYYGPRNAQTGKRPEPVLLPQILTPHIIKNTIQ